MCGNVDKRCKTAAREQGRGASGPRFFYACGSPWVYLSRRANQVSDSQERAHANENCHADGEHKPDKSNFLGVEAKAAHCSLPESCVCGQQYSATLRWREPPGVEWWAVPRLIFVRHRTMNRIMGRLASCRAARFWDRFSTSVNRAGPTQTAPWRLVHLAAAQFCGMAGPNAIPRCRESPDRIHLRA